MSHTLAPRCTVCGLVDDRECPECPGVMSSEHEIYDQRPWSHPPHEDGYVHEWHPQCLSSLLIEDDEPLFEEDA